jgi:hypothetical protein
MLHFTWDKTTNPGGDPFDIGAIAVIYDKNNFYQASFTAGTRHEGKYSFELNTHKSNKFADVYFTMLSNDREKAANSVYMGRVEF